MTQRRERLDVDPALVSVVHAEQRHAAVHAEHDVIRRTPADDLDAVHAHACGARMNSAERRAIRELFTHGVRNGRNRNGLACSLNDTQLRLLCASGR